MTNPFEDTAVEDTTLVEAEDLDVDAPQADDETDTVPDAPKAKGEKPAKEKKEKAPARPAVAEGYVTPVAFAKDLTKHLHAQGATNRKGDRIGGDGDECDLTKNPITSQMVYSYINNSLKDGAKHPFPVYKDAELTGGRDMVVKVDEGLAWWDEKNGRVAASKTKAAEKEAKKAEKAASKATEGETATEPAGPVEEAE